VRRACSFLIIWTNNWSHRNTVQLISWVEMKARNQNLLIWKDKKGCIIKKLFLRKREVMLECTIKCFLWAAQVGVVLKKAITDFSSEKATEGKALKHLFLWIEFIPVVGQKLYPLCIKLTPNSKAIISKHFSLVINGYQRENMLR